MIVDLIRQVLLSKYLGLVVRHGLTAIGGYLVARGVATPDQAAGASDEAYNFVQRFLASPELQELLGAWFLTLGTGSAVTKAKIVDAVNEEKLESTGAKAMRH